MSRLLCDPHPRMTKKPSASASASVPTSASAVQLLLCRGRRAAAADESIEFFSALRECQTRPHVSDQTGRRPADGTGKVRRSGGDGGGELLSTETGKHDYDWLLTPPATPLRSPATGGATGSAAALNRLARATSASYAKSNSSLSLTRRATGNPTSRLARSSSATHSSVNTLAVVASSRRLSHARTLSSASSSSSIIAASNASGSSTPLGSAATSPRTPAHARSTAENARSRPWDVKAHARQVSAGSAASQQRKAPSSNFSGLSSAPTRARPRATTGATSPRSTTVTSPQSDLKGRGANAVARSRFAFHSTAGSTALGASHAPHGVRPSIKPRGPVSAAVKQCHGNGVAAARATTQRWRSSPAPSPSPAAAAPKSAPRGDLPAKRSSMNGDGRKINVEKATSHRTAVLTSAAAKRTGNENVGRQYKDARHGGAPAYLKPTVHHRSIRSAASGGRLGSAVATYDGCSIAGGRSTSKKGKLTAAAATAARLTEPDAFPSTRYDAMLVREDPKNLTWLNGCGVDSDYTGSSEAGLVEDSLEPFDVPVAGMEGTVVRF